MPAQPPPVGLSLGDFYYAIFRHKWKIVGCSILGVAAAAGFYFLKPPPFESEAKLFIRYVMESKAVVPGSDEARMKTPDQRGETIIASELQILTSLDLTEQVAAAIGPARILGKSTGIDDRNRAANAIRNGLTTEVPAKSSVVRIAFQHEDPEIVAPVLRELVSRYLKRHVDIHQSAGLIGDFLTQETDQLRARLTQTEEELRKARVKAGVISLDDAKKAYVEQISRLREEILQAETELAAQTAEVKTLQGDTAPTAVPKTSEPESASASPPPSALAEYQRVLATLDTLSKREQELLSQFTAETRLVQDVRIQVAEAAQERLHLETSHPALVARTVFPTGAPASTFDPAAQNAQIAGTRTRLEVLKRQLEAVRGEVAALNENEGSVRELQRRLELEEANYRYLAAGLEQARFNEALSAGRISNISLIQEPSPPYVAKTKFLKIVIGLAAGGMAAGLGWALLIELYLDRTLRRPTEVERRTGIPLILSIPQMGSRRHTRGHPPLLLNGNGNGRHEALLESRKFQVSGSKTAPTAELQPKIENRTEPARATSANPKIPTPPPSTQASDPLASNLERVTPTSESATSEAQSKIETRESKFPLSASEPATADSHSATTDYVGARDKVGVGICQSAIPSALRPFHEALRDRLTGYFESRNLTHKPKLVAVTSLAPKAGVTTLAAGVAACMSETGEGNVLLVDMTSTQGSAQQFYQGKPVCDLDQALDTRDDAQIQDKLYVVAEGGKGDRLSRALPQRFTRLVPRLRASDFDYIIFDMPLINQISITPRLSSYMDIVLLVIESETTDRALVERARDLLAESKAYVGAVLNKTHNYVPRRLHQEALS